jgi:hypothetical protein
LFHGAKAQRGLGYATSATAMGGGSASPSKRLAGVWMRSGLRPGADII